MKLCVGIFLSSFAFVLLTKAATATEKAMVRGTIVVQTLDRLGTVQHNFRAPFEVKLWGKIWQMRVQYGTGFTELCGFDGKELCSVLEFSPVDFPETIKNGNVAVITPFSYPCHSEPITRVIWLALATDTNLVRSGAILPALWNMPFQNPFSCALKLTNVTWLDGAGFLPSALDFIQAKVSVSALKTSSFLSHAVKDDVIKEALNNVTDGVVDAEYRVGQATNWNESVFPKEFSLSVYAHSPQGSFPVQRYQGIVESLEEVGDFSPFPESLGRYSIGDYRFSDAVAGVDEISYSVTNFHWIAATNPVLLRLFNEKKQKAFVNRNHITKVANPKVVRSAVLFFLLTSTLLFFWKLKKHKTQEHA